MMCQWALNLQPIPGWTAKECILREAGRESELRSYLVKECPEFLQDDPRPVEDIILMALEIATDKKGCGSERVAYNAYKDLCAHYKINAYNIQDFREMVEDMGCCDIVPVGNWARRIYYPICALIPSSGTTSTVEETGDKHGRADNRPNSILRDHRNKKCIGRGTGKTDKLRQMPDAARLPSTKDTAKLQHHVAGVAR